MSTQVKLSLSDELVEKMDEARGLVTRQRWIEHLIMEAVSSSEDEEQSFAETVAKNNQRLEQLESTGVMPSAKRRTITLAEDKVDHAWVGIKDRCMRVGCPAPNDRQAHI